MYTPNCDVFWVGSFPYRDPVAACRRVLRSKELLLLWPQLPKKSKKELPFQQSFAALATKGSAFPTGSASGWNAMWRLVARKPKVWFTRTHFKSQIAGPITLFGKVSGDASNRGTSPQLLQYVTLWLKHAYWQIDTIRDRGFKPILVLDEPLLPTFMGSAGNARYRKTAKLLRSIVKRLQRRGARVGIHCCNRISPAVLADLGVDLIHFDAYHFPTQLSRSRTDLQAFMRSGGVVAWGVIPANESLTHAMQARVEKELNNILMSMESRGLSLRDVVAHSMVAPTCGTGWTSASDSESVLAFAENLSRQIKRRYSTT